MATFRAARETDLGAVLAMMRDYYAEDGYPFSESEARAVVGRLIQDGGLGRLWIAWDGDSPVGYLAVTFGYSFEYRGRDAFIDEVYVVPARRRRGIGAQALALAESSCREAGVRALHLEVERDKTAVQELYRRGGFSDRARFLMTKRLGQPPDEDPPSAGA